MLGGTTGVALGGMPPAAVWGVFVGEGGTVAGVAVAPPGPGVFVGGMAPPDALGVGVSDSLDPPDSLGVGVGVMDPLDALPVGDMDPPGALAVGVSVGPGAGEVSGASGIRVE